MTCTRDGVKGVSAVGVGMGGVSAVGVGVASA